MARIAERATLHQPITNSHFEGAVNGDAIQLLVIDTPQQVCRRDRRMVLSSASVIAPSLVSNLIIIITAGAAGVGATAGLTGGVCAAATAPKNNNGHVSMRLRNIFSHSVGLGLASEI